MRDTTELTRRQLLAVSGGVVGVGTAGCRGRTPFGGGEQPKGTGETGGGNAGGSGVVEDFETDLSAWNENVGVGAGSGLQGDTVKEGAGALELINVGGPGNDGSYTSLPGDGLPAYPSLGDTISVWARNDGGDSPTLGLCYLWQDAGSYSQNDGSGLAARVHVIDSEIELTKVVDGETVRSATARPANLLSQDTWYRLVVEMSPDAHHLFRLEDETGERLAQAGMDEDDWESGGYGLAFHGRDTDGESSYWDGLRLMR